MVKLMHQNLTRGRWFKLSLAEQLGNLGSEVGRASSRMREKDKKSAEKAIIRAIELLDLTLTDPRWRKRLKEIARAREVLVDAFYGDNLYHTTLQNLEKYFYYFAYYARREK